MYSEVAAEHIGGLLFRDLFFSSFGFASDFEIRVSNFA
jgi:hypothetical protein